MVDGQLKIATSGGFYPESWGKTAEMASIITTSFELGKPCKQATYISLIYALSVDKGLICQFSNDGERAARMIPRCTPYTLVQKQNSMVGSSLTLLAGSSMCINNLQRLWMFGGLNLEINKLVDCLYSFKNVFGKGQGKVECHCYPGPLRMSHLTAEHK